MKAGLKVIAALALSTLIWTAASAAPPAERDYDPTQIGSKPVPELPADVPVNPTRAFLWEVRSSANTVYLFGTIHVGKKSFYPLPPQVEAAISRSAKLLVEANADKPAREGEINKLIFYAAPDNLQNHVSAALYQRVQLQLPRFKLGEARVRSLRPFLLATLLSVEELQRLGYDPQYGVERYLLKRARQEDKTIDELESEEFQIRLLSELPDPLQEAFLENMVSTIEAGRTAEQVTGMVNAWQAGDPGLLQQVSAEVDRNRTRREELDAVLLDGRHPAMQAKIEVCLFAEQPCFVAVGALHLIGKNGLIDGLRAKGYRIRQL